VINKFSENSYYWSQDEQKIFCPENYKNKNQVRVQKVKIKDENNILKERTQVQRCLLCSTHVCQTVTNNFSSFVQINFHLKVFLLHGKFSSFAAKKRGNFFHSTFFTVQRHLAMFASSFHIIKMKSFPIRMDGR
jgi:hypothetical protein